ncbi:RnfABCDGE type electron transport complex subunit B [Limisalsivibrio acetivorans]|uniref:RnfABCDGE type electron transport complex subunit B n=1 Tax=Limisalsivibrio acetivorans TaxID=1304888 RepID=UPI0003B35801|nr:RnfABCDGE type electron transport complex subunit B [Limisalsivibrio acetivorans]
MTAAVLTMLATGFAAGFGLMVASKKFHVDKDPRIEGINELLPAANCGGCGFPGCGALAESIVAGNSGPDSCPVGGSELAEQIADYLGMEFGGGVKKVARVKCRGGSDKAPEKYDYYGPRDCHSIAMLAGGNKLCSFGCLGEGSCVKACGFDAMRMGEDRIPIIDPVMCTSCGMCVKACPRALIELIPEDKPFVVTCMSKDKGPEVKKNCTVGCIGCRLCAKNCPVGAIEVDSFLAKIDPETCINCGKCEEVCPTNAILKFED